MGREGGRGEGRGGGRGGGGGRTHGRRDRGVVYQDAEEKSPRSLGTVEVQEGK